MNSIAKSKELQDEILSSLQVGMRFQLNHKNKLGKKKVSENDDIEIMGLSSFKFKKDDTLIIDDLFDENGMQRVGFSIERAGKKVQDYAEKDLNFVFSRIIFVQRFQSISDMEDICNDTQEKVSEIL